MNNIKMLVLSLTGHCNFACAYCYASALNPSYMSSEIAIRAVEAVAASGEPFLLQFTGGEPLLNYSCLQKVVEYVSLHKLPARMQIQTNGSLLTVEIAEYLRLHKVGIGVSLDGVPRINDQLRITQAGSGATKEIVAGIRVLQELQMAVGLTCVISKVNVLYLAELIEFAYFLGNVRKIGFDLLRPQGHGERVNMPTPAEVEEGLTRAYQRNVELGRLAGYQIIITQQEKAASCHTGELAHCHAMTGEALFVNPVGEYYPCASFVDEEEYRLGDVATGVDEQRQACIREKIVTAMAICRGCDKLILCGGGCYARWQQADLGCPSECSMKQVAWEQRGRNTHEMV